MRDGLVVIGISMAVAAGLVAVIQYTYLSTIITSGEIVPAWAWGMIQTAGGVCFGGIILGLVGVFLPNSKKADKKSEGE